MARALLRLGFATAIAVLPGLAAAQQSPSLGVQQQKTDKQPQRQSRESLRTIFLEQKRACERDDLEACDQALAYPRLSSSERKSLQAKRSAIVALRRQIAAERERIAAEAAEAHRLEQERLATLAKTKAKALEEAKAKAREWPAPAKPWLSGYQAGSVVVGGLVILLMIVAYASGVRPKLPSWKGIGKGMVGLLRSVAAKFRWRRKPRSIEPAKPQPAPKPEPQPAAVVAPPPAEIAARAKAPAPRPHDTVGALRALELAQSYIEEVRNADVPDLEEATMRKLHLNTLALALKQLHTAQSLDAEAVLECTDAHGMARRFSIKELKAEALLLEGLTHQVSDVKRSIVALRAATVEDPNNPHAFFALGLTQASANNKTAAVAALRRAVELRPQNINYRKELGRAENLTSAEIAAYRSTRVGEKIIDASIVDGSNFSRVRTVAGFPLRIAANAFRRLKPTGLHR